MHITIAGLQGSGKSTVAELLRDHNDYILVNAGSILREYALNNNIDITTANDVINDKKYIDDIIDNNTINISNKYKNDNVVFDGRMAWHFVPNSVKVFFTIDDDVAAARIYNHRRDVESYDSISDTANRVKERKSLEQNRFKKLYNVDIYDKDNYDIVIDTTNIDAQQAYDTLIEYISRQK